jgi:hypothetical protein
MPSPYSRWYCALSMSKNLCLAHTRIFGHRNVVRGGDFSVTCYMDTGTGGVPTLTLLPSVGRRNKHTRSKQRAQNPTAKTNGDNYITSSFTICIPNTTFTSRCFNRPGCSTRDRKQNAHDISTDDTSSASFNCIFIQGLLRTTVNAQSFQNVQLQELPDPIQLLTS